MYSVCVCHKITEVSLQERSRNNSHCTYSHVKVHGISLEAKIGYRCVICGRVVFGVRLDCFSFSRCRNTRCSQLNWGAVQLWEVEVMHKLSDAPTSEFWDTLTLRCWSQTWCSRVWALAPCDTLAGCGCKLNLQREHVLGTELLSTLASPDSESDNRLWSVSSWSAVQRSAAERGPRFGTKVLPS